MAASFIFSLVIPLLALIGGILLIARSRRVGKPYPACGHCGYDMTGSIGNVERCPECGGGLARVGITPAGKVHRSGPMLVFGIGLVVLSTGCLGCGTVPLIGAYFSAQSQAQAARAAQAAQAAQQAAGQQSQPPPATTGDATAPSRTASEPAAEDLSGDRNKEQ